MSQIENYEIFDASFSKYEMEIAFFEEYFFLLRITIISHNNSVEKHKIFNFYFKKLKIP